ncbi:InlB B-repeat-containing protein, partial [Candidatus Symbiothrix dinenymphae]|uniref:InlB B-repeat-containing protein n=1 Tax=Candidatus Symbiothrix dinenymphae TaxID=467085 RepID=UPI00131589E1
MPAYTSISVNGVSNLTPTFPGTAGQTLQLVCLPPAATDTFLGWSYNAGHIPPNQIYSLSATYTIGTTGATVIARYGPRSAMTVVVSPPQAAVANSGRVDGTTSATKAGGTEVQLTRPTASDPGYQFDSWAVNGPSYGSFILHPGTALPDSFRFAPGNVTGNIIAHFKMRLRRGSAVTGGQIDPLLARDVYYSLGAVVNVTAYPASGYRFDQWTHGAGGAVLGTTNPLTVTIADTIVCVAEYVKTWTLTTGVNNLSGGSVAVTTAPSPLSAPNYDNGAAIAVEATANSGWRFSHWANGGTTVGTLPTYSTTINSDLTLTAHFEHIYKATVEVYPPGSGVAGTLLTGAPDTILATATTYAIANIFTAAPNAGYHFLNTWNNATLGLVGVPGFTPSTSYPTQAIQAVFEEDHKITPRVMNSADGLPHGTVQSGGATVAGPGLSTTATFNHNPPATVYTFTADPGYEISEVWVNNALVGAPTSYTFSADAIIASSQHTLQVKFQVKRFRVRARISAGLGSTVPDTSQIQVGILGGSLMYTITPAPGYEIATINTGDGTVFQSQPNRVPASGSSTTYTFVMNNHAGMDSILEVGFQPINYNIEYHGTPASIGGYGTVTYGGSPPPATYNALTPAFTLPTAAAPHLMQRPGYNFVRWHDATPSGTVVTSFNPASVSSYLTKHFYPEWDSIPYTIRFEQ